MINMILSLAGLALKLASLAMLLYCILSFVAPQSDLYRKLASYVEPLLNPVRMKLYSWFPSLRSLPVDLSPLALWILLDIANSLLGALRGIF